MWVLGMTNTKVAILYNRLHKPEKKSTCCFFYLYRTKTSTMNKSTSIILHALFLLIAGVELTGRITDTIQMEYWVKPLIMVWIAMYFILNRKKTSFTVPVLFAFFFSWLGDMFLMFSGGYQSEIFFFAGVGAFFLAQLSYILVFVRYSENNVKGQVARSPWLLFLFTAYLVGVLVLLIPGMEGIMIPIIVVYAISLVGMSVVALNRRFRVNEVSFRLAFAGSVLFVLSDSLIAINKFYAAIPLAGFWIMLTYMA
jgi:uncharacterized membrane protein YhhN